MGMGMGRAALSAALPTASHLALLLTARPNLQAELVPGGAELAVTAANLERYIASLARYKQYTSLAPAAAALGKGLRSVLTDTVADTLARCFSPAELNVLLAGQSELDAGEWREHTRVDPASAASSRQLSWLWAAVGAMCPAARAQLLAFVTGSSSLPAGGFPALRGFNGAVSGAPGEAARVGVLLRWLLGSACIRPASVFSLSLQPHPFTVCLVASEGDGRLPRASTCFNTLYLPSYSSAAVLEARLAQALAGGHAFDEGAESARGGRVAGLFCLAVVCVCARPLPPNLPRVGTQGHMAGWLSTRVSLPHRP